MPLQGNPLESLVRGDPALLAIAENSEHKIQVLYTQIDRDGSNVPAFRTFEWNVDAENYFYPASTVKLPAAVLALEKLNSAGVVGLGRGAAMRTFPLSTAVKSGGVKSEPDPESTVARYIREIFLVSSNGANNRLFEFVGPEELSDGLQRRGYGGVRIFHRLAVARGPGAILTNAITFKTAVGEVLHRQNERAFDNLWAHPHPVPRGVAYIEKGTRVERPKDFAALNAFPLAAQQRMLRALIFPESIPASERFRLSPEDRRFLLKEMSRWVSESSDPVYDSARYGDQYTKKLFFGTDRKRDGDPDIRAFSKSGMAYGTVTDNAYFADFDNGVEFFLSATILVNANRTFNDDIYEYDTIGIPFMRDLGRAVHAAELARQRLHMPDLQDVKFEYSPGL